MIVTQKDMIKRIREMWIAKGGCPASPDFRHMHGPRPLGKYSIKYRYPKSLCWLCEETMGIKSHFDSSDSCPCNWYKRDKAKVLSVINSKLREFGLEEIGNDKK